MAKNDLFRGSTPFVVNMMRFCQLILGLFVCSSRKQVSSPFGHFRIYQRWLEAIGTTPGSLYKELGGVLRQLRNADHCPWPYSIIFDILYEVRSIKI